MKSKARNILNDSIANLALSLPVALVAKLYGVSRAYVSKLLKENDVIVDKKQQQITVPAKILKSALWPKEHNDE